MKVINKDNIEEFMSFYHYFHDSTINDLKFNYKDDVLELFIDAFWSGEPILKEDNTYETNKRLVKLVFKDINRLNIDEQQNYGYIDDAYLKIIKLNNEEFICFATDNNEPYVYVVAKTLEYYDLG